MSAVSKDRVRSHRHSKRISKLLEEFQKLPPQHRTPETFRGMGRTLSIDEKAIERELVLAENLFKELIHELRQEIEKLRKECRRLELEMEHHARKHA